MGIRAPSLAHELLEATEIELRAVDLQHVARCPGDEPALPELLPQPRHVDLDALRSRPRRRLTPQSIDQAVGRNHLVGVQQQGHKERTLATAAEDEQPIVTDHLEWAKKTELHPRSQSSGHSDRTTEPPGHAGAAAGGPIYRPLPTPTADLNRHGTGSSTRSHPAAATRRFRQAVSRASELTRAKPRKEKAMTRADQGRHP